MRCRSSLSSRAFSIAITACAAKLSRSPISFSVKGLTSWRAAEIRPSGMPSFRSGMNKEVRSPASNAARDIGIGLSIAPWSRI